MRFEPDDAEKLQNLIKAAFVRVRYSSLGGKERASLLILVAIDPRETWINGILENSRYIRLHAGYDGKVEYISGCFGREIKKFRKANFTTLEDLAAKIQKYVDSVPEGSNS